MTTQDNKKMALIYEGPTEPEVSEDPNIPSPFWRDTSGETPVLKMHNADHSAWVVVAPEPVAASEPGDGFILTSGEIKLEDSLPLKFGTDGDVSISYDPAAYTPFVVAAPLSDMRLRSGSVNESGYKGTVSVQTFTDILNEKSAEFRCGTEGVAIRALTSTAEEAIEINASAGGVDIDGATGVKIDAPATKYVDIHGGAGEILLGDSLARINVGKIDDPGTIELVSIDAGGAVAGKIVADADGVHIMHGINQLMLFEAGSIAILPPEEVGISIQTAGSTDLILSSGTGDVSLDNFKLVGTRPTSLFHVGAMPTDGIAGQLVVDVNDSFKVKVCTVAGTPGTWVVAGTQA